MLNKSTKSKYEQSSKNSNKPAATRTLSNENGNVNSAFLTDTNGIWTVSNKEKNKEQILSLTSDDQTENIIPSTTNSNNLILNPSLQSTFLNSANKTNVHDKKYKTYVKNSTTTTTNKFASRRCIIITLIFLTFLIFLGIIAGVTYAVLVSFAKNTNSNFIDESKSIKNASNLTVSETNNVLPSIFVNESTCGIQKIQPNLQQVRIMHGKPAVHGSWPWVVSLGFYGPRASLSHACGGSLVNKRFVVTATHCVVESSIFSLVGNPVRNSNQYGSLAQMIRVYVGVTTRSTDIDANHTYRVAKVLSHPNFDGNTFQNDLTILQLDRDVEESDDVGFICLGSNTKTEPGTSVYAIGWGFTESQMFKAADTLMQVKFQVQSVNNCGLTYIPVIQFCAGNPSLGKDTCNGDSGGPIMQQNSINSWTLVGIVSNGDAACTGRGIYTNVSFYHKWIMDNTVIN